jgi:hypothetical protein
LKEKHNQERRSKKEQRKNMENLSSKIFRGQKELRKATHLGLRGSSNNHFQDFIERKPLLGFEQNF